MTVELYETDNMSMKILVVFQCLVLIFNSPYKMFIEISFFIVMDKLTQVVKKNV